MGPYNGGMFGLLAVLLLVAPIAPWQAPPTEQGVLFIGNSLTYSNDLPTLVAALARAKGVRLRCSSVAFPNYSLEDHWQRGDALREISKGGWSLVVLQQGPSAAPESEVLLREYVKRFDKEIRAAGARTSLFMVWPNRGRPQDFDGVIRSYTAAAKDVNAQLFASGEAWRVVWARDPELQLYSPDGLHPSPLGTYVAALVIVKTAFGISPRGLPAAGIDAATAKIVQDAVAGIGREPEVPGDPTPSAARATGRTASGWSAAVHGPLPRMRTARGSSGPLTLARMNRARKERRSSRGVEGRIARNLRPAAELATRNRSQLFAGSHRL